MLGDGGQIRFLRILRARTRAAGGFLPERDANFPEDFFDYDTVDAATEMNPPDAKGTVLGVSLPVSRKRR